ncbi:uncharacterized protein [Diadema setosum]|uniref:uncharacterized protein n=1 Tax=Diadema setosum TaxID=31175 RepID=UPI003B3BDFC3
MASSHIIEECVSKSQSSQNRCTYQTPSNATSIILTCVVSGFKPDIFMIWTDESGERLQSMASLQTTLSDDTYERLEKINVSVSETEHTFACIATGDSVNGRSIKEITLLPTSIISENLDNVGLIVGLVIGVPAAVTILFLLIRMFRQKRDEDYVPQVSQESLSTVDTIIDSEDDSRNWYSMKLADFKLCCRRLKDVSTRSYTFPTHAWVFAGEDSPVFTFHSCHKPWVERRVPVLTDVARKPSGDVIITFRRPCCQIADTRTYGVLPVVMRNHTSTGQLQRWSPAQSVELVT